MLPIPDMISKKFNRLTVTKRSPLSTKGNQLWECICVCGNVNVVRTYDLRSGRIRSCGCTRMRPKYNESDAVAMARYVQGSYKRNAIVRKLEYGLTFEELQALIYSPCVYCKATGTSLQKPKISRLSKSRSAVPYNGIDRVDNTRGYTSGNVVTCCKTCNVAKNNQTHENFLKWVECVYKTTRGII